MRCKEELLWILDQPGTRRNTLEEQEQEFRENIAFVHSLGLKCDSVGWCELDLGSPRAGEILEKIAAFCAAHGWQARGVYTRRYENIESDWYELSIPYFHDSTPCGRQQTLTEDARETYTCAIRAFYESSPIPKRWGKDVFVPERFWRYCIENRIDEFDFCWARDKGKYEAEQYFHAYGKNRIPRIAVDFDLKQQKEADIRAAGGWLPEIARVVNKLQAIDLQDCYLLEDMPERGIAYGYIPTTVSCAGRHSILIHKTLAQALVRQKLLPQKVLQPAPVVQQLPGGYALKPTQPIDRPTGAYREQMLSQYQKWKQTPRPTRMVTEKEALKLLREAKKERKEDFPKPLSKAKAQTLAGTDYEPMIPWYGVCDGGYLSEEYTLLPYGQALEESKAFFALLEREELLDTKPEGVVIAKCPDGDTVLLCKNGTLIRFSHEAPEITSQWQSLAQFFTEAVND